MNKENKTEEIGVHHLNVPHGPEGYLIAHHLYNALKPQGASMELADGTFVAPEVLTTVLSGPEGFGDWQSTKFVIVLPVSEPLKNRAQEYFLLRDEVAQAQLAMEDAQQRYQQALTKLGQAIPEEPRTPGWTHGGMFHANVTDTHTPNFFDHAKTEARMCDFDSALDSPVYRPDKTEPVGGLSPENILGKQKVQGDERALVLSGTISRKKPWTYCGQEIDPQDPRVTEAIACLNTTPAWVLYSEIVNSDVNALRDAYSLSPKEIEAFKVAYTNHVVVTMAPNTEEGFSFGSEKPRAVLVEALYYDDFVKYPERKKPATTEDD